MLISGLTSHLVPRQLNDEGVASLLRHVAKTLTVKQRSQSRAPGLDGAYENYHPAPANMVVSTENLEDRIFFLICTKFNIHRTEQRELLQLDVSGFQEGVRNVVVSS